jgi:molybdate-binding protein
VAATVAAGAAHAGFGIAAAAAQFRLGFVPLAEEVYALALRRDAFAAPAEASLLATLRGRAWREAVAGKPGYRAPARVSVQSLDRFMR